MADSLEISAFLQERLGSLGLSAVGAVDAAQWLDRAGLLRDSPDRAGKPLRDRLRTGKIEGGRQAGNRWYIDYLGQPRPQAGVPLAASGPRPPPLPAESVAALEPVLLALQVPRYSLRDTLPGLPAKPGLYAIYGDEQAWVELGYGKPPADSPLYVGKAEDSMVKRDLDTHFGNGRTGSSTVRRSFAALLRERLSLAGMPRNPENPGYFANYGLSAIDDSRLTRWMLERLEIAVWTTDASRALRAVEADVLERWNPPINIQGVNHPWRTHLQAQRKVMADQARAWRPESDWAGPAVAICCEGDPRRSPRRR